MTDIGDYRVLKKLGEGTFAQVVQVRHKKSGKLFALKRFKKQFKGYDEIEGLREIQALRRLSIHPNIIVLEEVIFDAKFGFLSLAFELMDANLYDILSKKGSPPIHEQKAKWILWQATKALDFIHSKGIFHRDIKPENILIRGDVSTVPLPFPSKDPSSPFSSTSSFPLVKLADFGSCRGIHSRMPYTEYIATRWYRSPECLLFQGVYTYKMDTWGMGCVFFELLTKIALFPGDDEIDQLHRIHQVLGTPSERLLKIMVTSGTQSVLTGPNGQPNPKAASYLAKGILKHQISFTPIKGYGIKGVIPQHILLGATKIPTKNNVRLSTSDFPGLSDDCLNLMETMLQYDPDARPTARQTLKHPFLKDCREAEYAEKQAASGLRDLASNTRLLSPKSQSSSNSTILPHLQSSSPLPSISLQSQQTTQLQRSLTLPRQSFAPSNAKIPPINETLSLSRASSLRNRPKLGDPSVPNSTVSPRISSLKNIETKLAQLQLVTPTFSNGKSKVVPVPQPSAAQQPAEFAPNPPAEKKSIFSVFRGASSLLHPTAATNAATKQADIGKTVLSKEPTRNSIGEIMKIRDRIPIDTAKQLSNVMSEPQIMKSVSIPMKMMAVDPLRDNTKNASEKQQSQDDISKQLAAEDESVIPSLVTTTDSNSESSAAPTRKLSELSQQL